MKNAVESINDENKTFKNNVIIIIFNYNVVEDAAVVVKIKNETLRNITLKQNFRNEHMRKNVFDENTKFSIEWNVVRVVNDRNQRIKNIIVINKIDNKQSNRLTKVRLEFNELIRNVNNNVFVITIKYQSTKTKIASKKKFRNFRSFLQFEKRLNSVFDVQKSIICDNNIN